MPMTTPGEQSRHVLASTNRLARGWSSTTGSMIAALLAGILVACSGNAPVCREAQFTEAAAAAFPRASAPLDFVPQRPCAFNRAFIVTSVFTDMLPGTPPEPRINFVVSRQGEKAFLFSQTRAGMPFSAIPLSTHRIRVTVGSVVAEGFAGPSGTGVDTAYLRWRADEVTFELDATLGPGLSESALRVLAAGLMRPPAREGAAGGTEPTR